MPPSKSRPSVPSTSGAGLRSASLQPLVPRRLGIRWFTMDEEDCGSPVDVQVEDEEQTSLDEEFAV